MQAKQKHLFLLVDESGQKYGHFIMSDETADQVNHYLRTLCGNRNNRYCVRADRIAVSSLLLISNAREHHSVKNR